MFKVVHVIPGLGKGGAETMLVNLLKYQSDTRLSHEIISLGLTSYYENEIRDLGVPLYLLDIKKRPMSSLWKLKQLLKDAQLISCWMYIACAVCYGVTDREQRKRTVWNIRHASLDPSYNSRTTMITSRYCQKRSADIAAILYNGEAAREEHRKAGYREPESYIVENGCDILVYQKEPEARVKINEQFGLQGKKIIISVGRYHPIKDYPTMLKAMGELVKRRDDAVLILCGSMLTEENDELRQMIADYGLTIGRDVFLLGLQKNISEWMSAADLYVLHSLSEAFPNVLLEAMACECVCISTDIGIIRDLLEENQLVKAGDYLQLAESMEHFLNLSESEKNKIGENNRQKIAERYAIQKIVRKYETIFYQKMS